jgi:Mrp family chromosome partitioning ATPase
LTDVLEGVKNAGDVILALDRPEHLFLLLAGRSPSNPVELLGGPAMGDLLAWLRERFDLIVLDTPPALNFADAGRLGVHMDGVVLVVRVGRTPREALAKTHRLLSRCTTRCASASCKTRTIACRPSSPPAPS